MIFRSNIAGTDRDQRDVTVYADFWMLALHPI